MSVEISRSGVGATASRAVDLARVFKALGDPTRLMIYQIVRDFADADEGHAPAEIENSIGQIASKFDLSLSTVSHHLRELRSAGLIRCERRGQSIHCSVERDVLVEVERFLAGR